MMRVLCVIVACAGLSLPALCQQSQNTSDNDPSIVMTMTLEGGELIGPGADALLARLPTAQFVLIGEDHGFSDPSEIALALAKAGRSSGLTNHVAEVGPITDELITQRLANGSVDDLTDLLSGRPLAIPFVNTVADAALADYFIDQADLDQDVFWGVDQEFIGSPLMHLESLMELATGFEAEDLVSALLEEERDAFGSGNQEAAFLFTATSETFQELYSSFSDVPDAYEIIQALEVSATIYQSFKAGRGFASNTARIHYMRQTFISAYNAAPSSAPRALFKFGAIHMARGTTFLNTFDLGSLTEGIAAANELDVLRIAVMPLEGEQLIVSPTADETFQTRSMRSNDVAGFLGIIGVGDEDIPEDGYAVIALEPIRYQLEQNGLNQLPPPAKFFILGYDYVVTTRGARAAVPIIAE
ncbi:MAG: hypothetical protein AAGF33_04560 [Pseudomonadota bacterium]